MANGSLPDLLNGMLYFSQLYERIQLLKHSTQGSFLLPLEMISLQVQNLGKKYGVKPVLKGLSFEYNSGILGISGINGSGKSTLMKCLSYLLRPSSGSVIWKDGDHELHQNEVKAILGYAAPYINLYSELSVTENLNFLMEVGGNNPSEGYLDKILDFVQLAGKKNERYGSLSTGQQQRLKLAATLIRNSKILMLDEPGSNLDQKGHALVSEMVADAKKAGKKIIIASNNPDEINLCDQVVEL